MSTFIEHLEKRSLEDKKVRAVLKKSLTFDPGQYPLAYPYVEAFINDESSWKREIYYLVAGLWAINSNSNSNNKFTISAACATYMLKTGSASIENRFITLIDSDNTQLFYRLRQMISLLKDYQIDFDMLLKDLMFWDNEKKFTQRAWAKEFYTILN